MEGPEVASGEGVNQLSPCCSRWSSPGTSPPPPRHGSQSRLGRAITQLPFEDLVTAREELMDPSPDPASSIVLLASS